MAAAAIFFTAALLLNLAARLLPGFPDWYAETVYSALVSVVGRVSGLFPFSLFELVVILILFFFIYMICRMLQAAAAALKSSGNIRAAAEGRIFSHTSTIAAVLCVLFFLYTAGCGINYHRSPFSRKEGFETGTYTAEELEEICLWLTENANFFKDGTVRDEGGVMKVSGSCKEESRLAMYNLAGSYASLEGYYPGPKKVLLSEIMSWQGITGIYSPFTIEANYNGNMTDYNIPFVMCHELSHLRGFMDEKEANFIAFLACINSESTEFNYCGYISGWVYCMNALYKADKAAWESVYKLLEEECLADINANNAYWESHEGKAREVTENINDSYLKANGQSAGVQGYDMMVDLVAAYYKQIK